MPTSREVIAGLYGAWRLARLDTGGMRWFNISIAGFWRSFFAAVLAAPGYALVVLIRPDDEVSPAEPLSILLLEGVTYIVSWVTLPVLAIFLTRIFALTDRYIGLIIANNWANVLVMAVMVPVTLLTATESIPRGMGLLLMLVTYLAILFYYWFVTRTALETTGLIAAGFVAADLVAQLLIDAAYIAAL